MDSGILQKHFNIISSGGHKWIASRDFTKYLRTHHKADDGISTAKRSDNIMRDLKKLPGGVKDVNGTTCVPLRNVIRFMYVHVWDLQSCKRIVDDIENRIECPELPMDEEKGK